MKNKTIILAYSGGLDTSFCLKRLSSDGFDVHAILVNTGGFDKSELNNIKKQAIQLGASKFVSIDAKKKFYNKIIKFLIFGNVLKNNSYPLSVSSERIIQAIEIMNYSKKNNINTIAHGSTGAGNDQVRFDSIFQIAGLSQIFKFPGKFNLQIWKKMVAVSNFQIPRRFPTNFDRN